MGDLDLKSKDELIAEIKLLKSKLDNGGLYFPGINVINKYERLNSQNIDKYKLLFQKSNDVTIPYWVWYISILYRIF